MLIPILLLNFAATAPSIPYIPLLEGSTSKAASEFVACFAADQEAQSKPLSFLPYPSGGGRISNEGAAGVTNPYQVRVVEAGGQTSIRALIGHQDGIEDCLLVLSIKHCW